jgi:hypothetical protein
MNRKNSTVKVTLKTAAFGLMGMSLVHCYQPPQIDANAGAGGVSGGGQSGSTSTQPVSGTGGTDNPDAASVFVNLDVQPAWWGELDAPQGPEVPPLPTIDSNCGMLTVETTRQPVDVLLLLDRSASMNWSIKEDCYCDRALGRTCADVTDCTDRWSAIIPAVDATLSNSNYVNWGLKFFGSSESDSDQCMVTPGAEVPIGADSAATIQQQIVDAKLSLGTPTAAGIIEATAYLKTVDDPNQKVILLATDGEPNCGGTPARIQTDDLAGSVAAATAALDAGFPVYVVGIGPNLTNLSQAAAAGGTNDYYPVTSAEDLTNALAAISKMVGSCDYKSSAPPPDENNIAVYVNKKRVNKSDTDGWKFGATTSDIVLTGSFCEQLTSGNSASVQILFGCAGAPPFPDFIP